MISRRLTLAAAAVAAGLLATACGGTTEKSGVSGEAGAALIRSGALAYAAVDSDLGSSQWQQVDGLLKKFPGRDKWLADLRRSLGDEDLDYDRDVKPALGPEVDVAVFAGRSEAPSFALLTKPDSMEKARALVRKLDKGSGEPAVTREVDGWLVVSQSDAMLDRVLKGSSGSSLADDGTFKDAVQALPSDALAKAYVNGRQLGELVDRYLGSGAQTTAAGSGTTPFGLDKLDWFAASVDAKEDGVRFQAAAKGAGGAEALGGGAAFDSKLISGVPADSFAFLDFRGTNLSDSLAKLRQNPLFNSSLNELERQLGVRLDSVLGLFAHEIAFYVRRGGPLPEFSLALEAPDTQGALTTVDNLARRMAHLAHGTLGTDEQGGVPVKTLTVKPVTVRWAGFDGRVLLTTGATGIADYRAGGSKLADDDTYKHALDAAGAPDKTGGILYLNIHDGLRLIESYLGLSGGKIPPDVAANLKPLQTFVAYNSTSGDVSKTVAFLEIK